MEKCDVSITTNRTWEPTVIWVDPHPGAFDTGTYNVSFTRSAQATVKLFTGGKKLPHRENLFEIYAPASTTKAIVSFCPAPLDAAIPPTQITVGELGTLGNDYKLYVALPDGETKDATVKAPAKAYVYDVQPSKYELRIAANDHDLEREKPKFCVGQKIDLNATWIPPLPSGAETDYNWVVAPGFINRIDPATGDSSEQYNLDLTLLRFASASIWWYEGGVADVWCNTTTRFSNGQSVSIRRHGQASVYRPQATFVDDPPDFVANILIDGDPYLSLGNGNSGDMRFQVTVRSEEPFSGRTDFTQLVNRYAANATSTSSTSGQFWLDNVRFYLVKSFNPNEPATISPTHPRRLLFADGPCIEETHSLLGGNTTRIADQFVTHVVFRPDEGNPNNNIYVSLGMTTWSWSATATWNGTVWTITGPSTPRPTNFDRSDSFPPTWLRIYRNN
jgi:hypothetical protein